MDTIVLVIHGLITLALIAVVLVQRSEGGGLGIGGGGGGGGGLMSSRGAANLLTRTTAILATLFFVSSILLAVLSGAGREAESILDQPAASETQPTVPSGPSVPTSE